jgi:hypothetical protein
MRAADESDTSDEDKLEERRAQSTFDVVILYVSDDVGRWTKACFDPGFRSWLDRYLTAPVTCMAIHSNYAA